MSIFKRGRIYWYKFMWNGDMVRESTRQPNQNTARQMEAAHRASLAKGQVGIREKKTVPTLADFISQRFEPWAAASTSAKTWLDYYRPGIRTIQMYKPIANLRLDEITSEKAADFAAWRQWAGLQVSSSIALFKFFAVLCVLPRSGELSKLRRWSKCSPGSGIANTSSSLTKKHAILQQPQSLSLQSQRF
jgi:hypothetical protein